MSTINVTKKTTSTIKEVSLALILTCSLIGVTLSSTANAAPVKSIESSISDFVIAQGEKMIAELNKKLQQSIDNQISNFSANFSLDTQPEWITVNKQEKQEKQSTDVEPEINANEIKSDKE